MYRVLGWLAVLLVSGCATLEGIPDPVPGQATPKELVESARPPLGSDYTWGGVVLSLEHVENSTLLELISYPLDAYQRPQVDLRPNGRFLAKLDRIYQRDRLPAGTDLTLHGVLKGFAPSVVQPKDQRLPVIEVDIWRSWVRHYPRSNPEIGIGFGVGSGGSGVGVGVGF